MEALATGLIAHFSYAAVFLLLLACGVGAPLSEEVIIVLGGALVGQAGHPVWPMMLVAYVGELGGDLLLFGIGRKLGAGARKVRRFERLLTPRRMAWVERMYQRRGALAVSIVRFIPGVRSPALLMAGMGKMRTRTFLLADGIAATVTAPLLTWLGYHFGRSVLRDLKIASHWVAIGAGGVLLLTVAVAIWRNRSRRAHPAAA